LTIVVLIVLVLVWAVVLGPSLLRRTVDRQHKDSIGSFHRQLHVLGRTGPSLMPPAHRLGTSLPVDRLPVGRNDRDSNRWLVSVSSRPPPSLTQVEAPGAGADAAGRRPDPYFRRGACKRRRDVLMVLLCTLTVTGLVGVIPALHVLLFVTALAGVVLIAYVALLIRLRSQALEREVKLRYLPRQMDYELPIQVRRTASR
jgi:hypothetical protein